MERTGRPVPSEEARRAPLCHWAWGAPASPFPGAQHPLSSFCLRLGHPTPESGPPLFTVTIYSSFLLFVRNSHKNQCKTIRVGVLFYITKLLLI